jgi:mRNA-degrading endonuclease RelE of RelBE toxin-antitoxin system
VLNVRRTKPFLHSAKALKKNYRNILQDIKAFENELREGKSNPQSLGHNIFKHRVANRDKNRGKRGGYRVITYFVTENNDVLLIEIYDKGEIENIPIEKIREKVRIALEDE